jgi:DnaJ-class molecular chaperone
LYDLLEVSPHASPSVIRAAYRCLAQSAHPDKHWGDGQASERQAHINGAYAVLSDTVRRRRYDQTLGLQPAFVERRRCDGAPLNSAGADAFHKQDVRAFAFRPLV